MSKIILCMHTTLDGFVAGPKGEMDWINLSPGMFDFVGKLTDRANTALYGRVTYQMMDGYWPTAGDQPNASKHDIEHSQWYNRVTKVVLSRSMKNEKRERTKFVGDNVLEEISKIKQNATGDILIFGSPRACHTLMALDLIDDYWPFVNPVLLGQGIPLFDKIKDRTPLHLVGTKTFAEVVSLHYERKRQG
ncbi:dihydrofolate reductase family protein [Chryseolinea soli]|uniref:Dihydrofolate reductase n=1 Tax=Chryseolinea soli TaxID=2321403 RepID=A0A385STZ8_9BACT|nr:dihydrofolate reductase family protein [Chryseolinea soli]AYB33445.1 dihydrofolate reductase [Chryseolinea soli]